VGAQHHAQKAMKVQRWSRNIALLFL